MPGTFLNFPFDDELFLHEWGNAPDPVLTALLQSGALVEDSTIGDQIQGKGNFYTIPFYNVLSGDPVNYDGQTDITSTETDGDSQSGVVFGRAKGFTARNFVAELVGNDPMGNIASNVGRYWNKYDQSVLIKILNAIFGITSTSDGYAKTWNSTHILDLSSTTATATKIGETDLNDLATISMGDHKQLYSLAIMHSTVANTLEKKQLLEYWKYTDANGIQRNLNLASCNGFTVLVDDGVPTSKVGGTGANKDLIKYTTYLLGQGVIRTAKGRVDVPVEVSRDPAKNGGQDTLYTRRRQTLHPNGFSFKKPATGFTESPTDAQLADKANWEIKFDPKAIPMAMLITNG